MLALIEGTIPFRPARLGLAACLVWIGGGSLSAQCRPPNFRVGQDYIAAMFISMDLRDFTLDRLTCLAQTLRNSRSDRDSFAVFFFDSHEAARKFRGMPVEGGQPPRWSQWAKHLHASYSFDAGKEETLSLTPMGFATATALASKLDVPIATPPYCHVELANRCLVAGLDRIAYPTEARRSSSEVAFVLAGTILPNGRVSAVHLADRPIRADRTSQRLAQAAIRDLQTWQFDTGKTRDTMRIEHSFSTDDSLPEGSPPQVQWTPPNQVKIRAGKIR